MKYVFSSYIQEPCQPVIKSPSQPATNGEDHCYHFAMVF